MKLYLIFLVCLTLASCSTPPDFPKCKRSDPEIEKCFLKGIEEIKPKLKDGIPEINLPPLEPFKMDQLHINSSITGATVQATITNIEARGGSDFTIEYLRIDLNERYAGELKLIFPKLQVSADYETKGSKMLLISINGEGKFVGSFSNVEVVVKAIASPITKDGVEYLQLDSITTDVAIGDGDLKVTPKETSFAAPFRIKELSADSSTNGAKVHAIHRHIVAHGGSNYRIENFKVDFHNKQKYIGNLTLIYPRLWISAQYQKKGIKMHFNNFHTRGSFKGIFDNVRAELRCVGSPIIKNGVEYLQLDTVTAEVSIENSNLQLKPFDHTKYGQYIADFARDYPYEALQKEGPVINEVSARLFKQYMNEALITMPLKNMLAD